MTDKQGSLNGLDLGSAYQTAYNLILRQRKSAGLSQGKLNTFLTKMDYLLERIEQGDPKKKWFFRDLGIDLRGAQLALAALTETEKNFQIVRILRELLKQIELAVGIAESSTQKGLVANQFTESVATNNKMIREKLKVLMQP